MRKCHVCGEIESKHHLRSDAHLHKFHAAEMMTVGQEIRMNILILGQFADILTTYVGLQKFGMREANPIARWAFENLGFTNAVILKLAIALFFSKHVGSLSCAITWMAPLNNVIGMIPE